LKTDDNSLNQMRLAADPIVDDIVTRHLAANPGALGSLLSELFRTSGMSDQHPLVSAYMAALSPVDIGDPAVIQRGQRVFDLFGPEILLTLGSYALPLAYACGNGAQAVYRARRLKEEPIRRLCDTAQMVINVMQSGELEPGGIGWYSTRKVRLIHALVRHHVQSLPGNAWSMEWGTPINQEDQAGTLLSFSIAVLDGLRKMGAQISTADANAYILVWTGIGRLLGVDESLLPSNETEAAELALRIGQRQLRATPEGRELNAQLLGAVESLFHVKGYALSLTHFFLLDTVFGNDVTRVLNLPAPNWTHWLVKMRAAQKRLVLDLLNRVPGARARRSFVAQHFAQKLLLLKRPDEHVPFQVPGRRAKGWRVTQKNKAPDASRGE
jgi:hypothetical protein